MGAVGWLLEFNRRVHPLPARPFKRPDKPDWKDQEGKDQGFVGIKALARYEGRWIVLRAES